MLTIPANTNATVYIPARTMNEITEGGKNISSASGVKFIRIDGEFVVLEVGSGDYTFKTQ
jgi:alpha-L-rhamnosidase